MTQRTNKLGTLTVLPHLVVFGLVAAIIVISFGFATSSWLLGVRKATLKSSRIGEAGIEFHYPRSAVALNTEDTAPAATIADPPRSVGASIPLPSAVQHLMTSDVQPAGPGSSSNFETPSDEVANPTQETSGASSTQGAPIDKTLGASQEGAPVSMPPRSQVVKANPTASPPPVPAVSIPNEERDRVFEAVAIQHSQPAKLDLSAIPHQTTPAQPVQNRHADEHPLGSKTTFQYRVKKECGPIHDPQLRHDCIRSFGANPTGESRQRYRRG